MKRSWWRRLRLGLQTLLTFKPAGYFIPYRYAALIPRYQQNSVAYPTIWSCFQHAMDQMTLHRKAMDDLRPYFSKIMENGSKPEPRWGQDWFPRLDALSAYTMVHRFKPNRLIEIGSGHSTRFYHRAIRDCGCKTSILAIDPAPRADLSDLSNISFKKDIVQNIDRNLFLKLSNGDFLSIDSSHILVPASDVDILLNSVLDQIPSGCFVHIHDIFLPWDYPNSWHWRGYNEQSGIATLLLGNGFDILWSSQWALNQEIVGYDGDWVLDVPILKGAYETSLWLRKK